LKTDTLPNLSGEEKRCNGVKEEGTTRGKSLLYAASASSNTGCGWVIPALEKSIGADWVRKGPRRNVFERRPTARLMAAFDGRISL